MPKNEDKEISEEVPSDPVLDDGDTPTHDYQPVKRDQPGNWVQCSITGDYARLV